MYKRIYIFETIKLSEFVTYIISNAMVNNGNSCIWRNTGSRNLNLHDFLSFVNVCGINVCERGAIKKKRETKRKRTWKDFKSK